MWSAAQYCLHASSCSVQELQVEIADWHQIKRIRPTGHMRRTVMPDLSVDKVRFFDNSASFGQWQPPEPLSQADMVMHV